MQKLTISQQEVLSDLKDYYDYCSKSRVREQWLNDCTKHFNYYYGNQWQDKDVLESLKTIACKPMTFNHLKPACNDVISVLIRSGKRVGYLPTNDLKLYDKVAEYLKNWAFNIQTQTNHSFYSGLKILSSLLSGIGWSHFGYEDEKFFYENIDSREIYWDPDDLSPRFDSSNVICRSYFVNKITLKNKYPKLAKHFDDLVSDVKYPDEFSNVDFYNIDPRQWVKGKSIRIVEVYYKKSDKFYETLATVESDEDLMQEEHVLQTFYEEQAEKFTIDGEVKVKNGTKIYKGVFCNDILISHGAIEEQVPNQKYFPIVPMVHQRDLEGKPIGIINDVVDIQDMINIVVSTIMHFTDSKTLISNFDGGKDSDKFAEAWAVESRKKNGSLFLSNVKDFQVIDNKQNVEHRLKVLQELKSQMQSVMRIYDDFAGKETNRISGVAINASVTNNINAQNFLVLSYEHMLTTEGKLMLDTLKGINNMKQVFSYYKEGESKMGILEDYITMLNFEVYPETAPNFSSSIEEEKAKFAEILSSPSRDLLLSSPLFLQEAGITDASSYRIHEEFKRIMSGGNQQQEEAEVTNQEPQQQQIGN